MPEVVNETVNETVNEEVTETTNEDVTEVEETADEVVEKTEIEEEFDPDNFDDEDLYTIDGINFSDLSDELELGGEGRIELLTTYVKPFIEQGFTEEQIKFIIKRDLEFDNEDEAPKKKTASDIQTELKKGLTVEEKKNYKAINRFTNELLGGTELDSFKKEIMQTPQLVKLLNIMYTKSLGKTININSSVPKVSEKQIKSVSFDDAYKQINESLRKGNKTETKKLVDSLSNKVNDKENFSAVVKALGL